MVEFYVNEAPKIFPWQLGLKSWQHWFVSKFSEKPLQEALKRCFTDKRLAESKKRLVIPSYNMGEDDVYLFRTPHAERLRRDYKVPAWKIALATSAAPTYFPCCRYIDSLRLIDGGVWANNPTMVGIVEAQGTLDVPLSAIRVLSIGTSDSVVHRKAKLNWGGLLPWAYEGAGIDIVMRGQSIGVNNQATFLLGKNNVIRLNPKVAADEYSLDGAHKTQDLIGKAAHYSRIEMPRIKALLEHQAQPYTPLYT